MVKLPFHLLQVGDISASQTACNNFILAGYTAGWDICYALAARPESQTQLDRCGELLAFAASHCDKVVLQQRFSKIFVEGSVMDLRKVGNLYQSSTTLGLYPESSSQPVPRIKQPN